MDRIDLDELERLFDEDIDMDGEKLEAFGTQVMLSDGFKYAHAFAKSDDFWLAGARARLIAAAINAVPELIARVRELERQSEALAFWLAQFLPHAECPIFEDCPLSHKKNVEVRDCAKQLIQGVLDHD